MSQNSQQSRSSFLLTLSINLYQSLLHLYPAQFRNGYAHEMLMIFRDCCREAVEERGSWGIAALWVFMVGDLIVSVWNQRLKAWMAFFQCMFGLKKEPYMSALLQLEAAARTDKGITRANNEDAVLSIIPPEPQVMTEKGALFVVADGMGGHAKGDVASEMAVNLIRENYYQQTTSDSANALREALLQAHQAIYERNQQEQLGKMGMATTCVAAVLQDKHVYVANAGDSLAYVIRQGQVRQIAENHSWVAEQVRLGKMTLAEARAEGKNNVITRCLGYDETVDVYVTTEEVAHDDILVLCTDGLHNLVGEDELRTIVEQHTARESVELLIERANAQGGPDNITAVVVHIKQA